MANQWDAYIDNLVVKGDSNLDKASIIGRQGGSWTSQSHPKALQLNETEIGTITKAFNTGDVSSFQQQGLRIGGEKFQFLRSENDGAEIDCIYGKKAQLGNVTIQKTKQALIIASTPDGKQAGKTNTAVDDVAKYLKDSGY